MASSVESVLNYLKEQNRPYSLTDIFNNLHKAIGKAVLQRDLDSLVQSGQVVEKTYGKQKIYYASQKDEVASTDEDLAAIDGEIETLKEQIQSKLAHLKDLEAQLGALNSAMSADDCRREIKRYKKLNEDLEKKVKLLEERGQCKLDPTERAALAKQRDSLSTELKKRRKTCTDAVSFLLESFPGKKSDLYEEIGLEMDPT